MRAVVGAPGGNKADDAEQTPPAAVQSGQTAGQAARGSQDTSGASPEAAPSAGQKQTAADGTSAGDGQASAGPPASGQTPASDNAGRSSTEQAAEHDPPAPGFGERGRMRRRARFLRKARELAYRDLGGLVFDLHRFGQRNDPLVLAKLATLREIDTELRGLESGLRDRRPVTVLREVGIAACPRCAAIHGSDDRFCPGCGLAFDANADRPISTAPVISQAHTAPAPAQPPLAAPPTAAAAASVSSVSGPGPTPPALKPTASPVAAKPNPNPPALPAKQAVSAPVEPAPATAAAATKPASNPRSPRPRNPERKTPEPAGEDEPTQVLRPPHGDANA